MNTHAGEAVSNTIRQCNAPPPPLLHQFDLLPLFLFPSLSPSLSPWWPVSLSLSLSDRLTDITAQCVLLVHGHTINSGFTASFPLLPSRCLSRCEWASGAGWIFTAAFRVSQKNKPTEARFLSNMCVRGRKKRSVFVLYCWLDGKPRQASTNLLIYRSIYPSIRLLVQPAIHPPNYPAIYTFT